MKKLLISFFIFFAIFFILPKCARADLIINEFCSHCDTEWVELVNTDENTSVNLAGYSLIDESTNTLLSLSGTIPLQAMLTFDLPSNTLANDGGCIVLFNGTTGVSAVSYGNKTCTGSEPHITAPSEGKTGAMLNGSTLTTDQTATKGWCNDSYGGCPTIASITTEMSSHGVKTNLGDQDDLTRITGLYFQKSQTNDPEGLPIGKITFLSEMNFTDRYSLQWMQSLNSYIDMGQNRIGLNADLIKNLVSTNATLTMYNVTLGNPRILVDGSENESVVSGLSYDRTAQTLTFTAAHFTTFTAVEQTSSSSSSSTHCGDQKPEGKPWIFQKNPTSKNITIYWGPINPITNYYIAFGTTSLAEGYGLCWLPPYNNGVHRFTLNYLSPNTTYYIKVRGGNGCMTGDWSDVVKVKTYSNYNKVKS